MTHSNLFLCFQLALVLLCQPGCRRPEPEPTLPAGAPGEHGMAAVLTDWSFLGPSNPDLVREQALMQRPFVAQGNLVPEEPEIVERQRGEAVGEWVSRIADTASGGAAAVVTLTMTHCVGWGSATPSEYTVFGCFTPQAVFVHPANLPAFETNCRSCSRDDGPCVERECAPMLAQGYFTGRTRKVQMDSEDPSTARVSFEFHVLRYERALATSEALEIDPEMAIRLPAGFPAPSGTPPKGGLGFAVAHEVDMVWAPASLEAAGKMVEELKAFGFAQAFFMDSRLVPDLWCCSHLVIASRHASSRAATDALRSMPPPLLSRQWRVVRLH